MKSWMTFMLILFVAVSLGQTSKTVDTLNFCKVNFKVPTGCEAESKYRVKCDDYTMVWIYLTPQLLQVMPENMVNQMAGQFKEFNKKSITCYLLDSEVKGYKISFKIDKGKAYQLIAYGIVNDLPVMVQLSLGKEPKSNEDIPEFLRQIIRLSK